MYTTHADVAIALDHDQLIQVHYVLSMWDSCHNITIREDTLSDVFSYNVSIVLLILKYLFKLLTT